MTPDENIENEGHIGKWFVFRSLAPRDRWPFRCSISTTVSTTLVEEMRQFNVITFGPLGGDVSAWRYSVVMTSGSVKAGFAEEKERMVFLLHWSDLE